MLIALPRRMRRRIVDAQVEGFFGIPIPKEIQSFVRNIVCNVGMAQHIELPVPKHHRIEVVVPELPCCAAKCLPATVFLTGFQRGTSTTRMWRLICARRIRIPVRLGNIHGPSSIYLSTNILTPWPGTLSRRMPSEIAVSVPVHIS